MAILVLEPDLGERLLEQRRAWGGDKYDEVWDGVYVMTPLPNDEHQELAGAFSAILQDIIGWPRLGKVRPGVNVSDRDEDWTHNYRAPDVVVFLNDTKARNCDTHWVGGPDFLVEITSPFDKTRDKLPFYEKVGVREMLLVDRDPWQLELYQLKDDQLILAGRSTVENSEILTSAVVPLKFRLTTGDERSRIEVTVRDGEKRWTV